MSVGRGVFQTEGHEAQNGRGPEQEGEASEEILAELDPLRSSGRRSQLVESILDIGSAGLLGSQTVLQVGSKPASQLSQGHRVDIQHNLLLQVILISLLGLVA